jgi:L-alanine-DL-glutamate epimerase-like enolase superfamily enzyme
MKLRFEPHTLFFIHPFKIAHGVRTSTPVVITRLECEGQTGYGEASMPPYLGESHDTVIAFLKKASAYLETISTPEDIPSILKTIDGIAKGNTAAKASIDIALHDLRGRMKNSPCWKLFGAEKEKTPFSTFTLGIDEPVMIRRKIAEADAFRILKVKLNGIDDRQMIDTIRSVTDKPVAVDVNQGWKTKEHALEMIEWLSGKNVLFVEQAMPKEDHDAARWLFERSPLPLYADESVQRLSDIEQLKDCYHGINIKLMKCTGLYEANEMIKLARSFSLKVLIGCMSETSCAVSAAAQLTPFADHADLDGPLLIKNDLFRGIGFEKGKIMLNDKPGIGVEPVTNEQQSDSVSS